MRTKDIQYFLKAEKNFCGEHPDYGELKFTEFGCISYVGG